MLLARTMLRRGGERQTRIRLIRRRFLARTSVARDAHQAPLHRGRVLGAVAGYPLGPRRRPARLAVLRAAKTGPAEHEARATPFASDLEALHRIEREAVTFWITAEGRERLTSVERARSLAPSAVDRGIGARTPSPSPTRSHDRHRPRASRAPFRQGRVGPGEPGGRGPLRRRWCHHSCASRPSQPVLLLSSRESRSEIRECYRSSPSSSSLLHRLRRLCLSATVVVDCSVDPRQRSPHGPPWSVQKDTASCAGAVASANCSSSARGDERRTPM